MSAHIGFDTPSSTMTRRVSYDPGQGVLTLHVRTGAPIHLAGVPQEIYHAVQKAPSVGKFYHASLKGTYKAVA